MTYAPVYPLWSDGAEKQRFIWLPPDTQIDTSDMDNWQFPVGTKAWKEFRKDGMRLETRLLMKTERGWYRIAFAWNDDETEAVEVPRGRQNVRGTSHDIPDQDDCGACHEGRQDRLLGIGAIQLSGTGTGATLASLRAAQRLSHPPSRDFALPRDPAWDALGYLHANCGNCHNRDGEAYDRVDVDLWLSTDVLATPEETPSYRTTVDAGLTDTNSALTKRIEPGAPDQSGLILRMRLRGDEKAMPPIGTETPDSSGLMLLEKWIESL